MAAPDAKKEMNLMEYWQMVVKRRWVIAAFTGAVVVLTMIFSFLTTPLYKSTARLLIEEEASKMLSIDATFRYQPRVVSDLTFFNTQVKLLKSKSLAERVAQRANVMSRPEFGLGGEEDGSLFRSLKNLITFAWLKSGDRKEEGAESSFPPDNVYSEAAMAILRNISVKPIRETKLVDVSFVSPDPKLAQEIVNIYAEEFQRFSVEKRYEYTQQASDFLSDQIAELRKDLEAKEIELNRYGKEKDIFDLSPTENIAVTELSALSSAYREARLERIEKEAIYRELQDLGPDSLPRFVNDAGIQELIAEYVRLKSEYDEKLESLRESHPEMVQRKARMESLWNEIQKAVESAESDYNAALEKEIRFRTELNRQKEKVATTDSNAIQYNMLKDEVANIRKLINTLDERRTETQVSAKLRGLEASNISIIDRGELPGSAYTPNKKLNFLLALIIGLFGGAGLCIVLEYLDNTVKGPEDVEKLADLPSLGIIPRLAAGDLEKRKKKRRTLEYKSEEDEDSVEPEESLELPEIELVNHHHPKLIISEDYRTVRTSILLSHADRKAKSIVLTSALPREGKSVTLVNLAVAFSQLGERVVVVDSDLRKPRLHRIFNEENSSGLTEYLTGKISLQDAVRKTFIEDIFLVPSGPIPPNPSELLNSKKMKHLAEELGNNFDYVFFDSPPILAVIDGIIMSTLADCTVFVVRAGKTQRKPFLTAVGELRKAGAKLIGVVFNELEVKKGEYYFMDYYRYYKYEYYGDSKGQTPSGV